MSAKYEMNGNSNNLNSTKNVMNGKQPSQCVPAVQYRSPTNESSWYTFEAIQETANFLLEHTKYRPKIGIICGSGFGAIGDKMEKTEIFNYTDIPNFPVATVPGHSGKLIFGLAYGVPVMCMQGRFHYYEGYPLTRCSMPVRVMKLLGITHLIATNAAGGLNESFNVGDLMIVKDHINIMGFAGNNPLQGPNDPRFGSRFPAMNKAYDKNLIQKAKKIIKEMKLEKEFREGVYTCLGGPNYETVAELRLLRILGIDAVGMSTVHEVIIAKHCQMTVFAMSLITNKCVTDYDTEESANHEEVIYTVNKRQKIVSEFLEKFLQEIHKEIETQEVKH